MRVAILGPTGMLGSMVHRVLKEDSDLEVVPLYRDNFSSSTGGYYGLSVEPGCSEYFDIFRKWHREKPLSYLTDDGEFDYVINCVGSIKPVFSDAKRIANAIYTNAVFPRELSRFLNWCGTKLIHITTDCVFDGGRGNYTEKSLHNALDEYGKSKSLGEPDDCMVLRTSIIGPELCGRKRSLVEWLISKRNEEIDGFVNHFWNGLTTLEFARCIHKIIKENLYKPEKFHIYSSDTSKFDLLSQINTAWDLNIRINRTHATETIDRTLRTVKDLNRKLAPKTLPVMIEELRPFIEAPR